MRQISKSNGKTDRFSLVSKYLGFFGKAATLGLGFRQWVTCTLICALLSISLTAPTGLAYERPADDKIAGIEPVNDEISPVTALWRSMSAAAEARLTPWRPANIGNAWPSDNDKLKAGADDKTNPAAVDKKQAADATKGKGIADADKNQTEANDQPLENDTANPVSPDPAAEPAKPVAPVTMFNQIPDAEHDSIYSSQNNLGSPKGQVEQDSPNPAAALRIKHRAGIADFSFELPLASLTGRGINAGVSMTYNSRTWNKSCSQYTGGTCTTDHYTYDVEQSWLAPGFKSGFGYLETTVETLYYSGNIIGYRTRPVGITETDGTRRQLTCTSSSGPMCFTVGTTDGSMLVGSGDYVNGNPAATTFTITYPNGSRTTYSGATGSGTYRKNYPVAFQDSNGNKVRIAYKAGDTGRIDYIIDTINRKIQFYYENDGSGNPDKLVAITKPGMGTSEELQTVRFYYDTLTLNSSGKFVGDITAPSSIRVLSWVYMPATKTAYNYDYSTSYGMIKKITRYVGVTASSTSTSSTGTITNPTSCLFAASTEYDFPDGSTALTGVPRYTKRTDDWQGRTASSPQETLYDSPEPTPGVDYTSTITVKDNGFDVEYETVSDPVGMLKETSVTKIFGPSGQYSALMSKSKYTWSTARNLTRLEVTNDAGLTKASEFEYDSYNNQTKARECDYASPGTSCTDGTARRRTETTYETGSGWVGRNLISLPKTVKTIADGVTVAKSTIEYDHNGSDSTLVRREDIDQATHDIFYNPDYPEWDEEICPRTESDENGCVHIHHYGYTSASRYRGNVTKVTRFSDATLTTDTNADVSDYEYDIAGNQVSATLSCCNLKTVNFGSSWSVTGYAFPVSETKGSSPAQLTTAATYNLNTGLLLTATDENSQTKTYEYETDTLRPKKTTYANGGYIQTEYSDKLVTTTSDLLPGFSRKTMTLDSTHSVQNYAYHNGRGDAIRSAFESTDGWLITATEFDALGRTKKSFNPFYGSTPTASIPSGQKFTQVNAIDALGRITETELQDGTKLYTYPDESTVTYTAPNSQSITGVVTRAKDQTDKERRQIIDSLGRIVRLDEPTASGLGSISSPNQPTYYEYDGNNKLSKVIQSDGTVTQERKFKYDSLSRLIAEKEAEASPTLDLDGTHGTANSSKWTKVLKYSVHGLLTDGYDARGVHAQMSYDGLNRVTSVTYTGETGYQTPAVTYTYDQARSGYFNNGGLTKVETASSGDVPATKTEFDYNLAGRLTKHRQFIGTQEYDLEYGYNLMGQPTSEKYPSGKIVTYSYDANGRLASIADASRTFLSGLLYQGNGGTVSSMNFGNSTNETFTLNDRFQLTAQELKNGSITLQKYSYGYGQIDGSGNLDTTKNNGQLGRIESYIGSSKQWTQKFAYDSVGRLAESKEYRGDNSSLTYKQTFDFDRFGNMYRKAANNGTSGQANPLPYTPIEDSDISKATNQITSNTSYDEAGNVTTDNKFRTMGFSYDANGRMVKATKTSVPDALSVYDASGLRVAERVNDVWRFFIYDIAGRLVSEYGGPSSIDEGGVKYLLSDWQGSTRAVVNNSGTVMGRSDYSAFGEEIAAGTGMRTAAQGFGSSNYPRQKYAATERDAATELDHTPWRKHENRAARWTSPDPYNGSINSRDPQSFNRYGYVQNDPVNHLDPSGLLIIIAHGYGCHIIEGRDGSAITVCERWEYTFFDDNPGGGPTGGHEPGGGGGGGTVVNTLATNCSSTDEPCNHSCLNREEKSCAKDGEDKFNEGLSLSGAAKAIVAFIGTRSFINWAGMTAAEITETITAVAWWVGGAAALGLYLYNVTQGAVAVENECRKQIPKICGEGCKKWLPKVGRA